MLCVHEAIKGPAELVIIVKPDEILSPSVTEPPNYDGPHVPVIVIMTSDSRTYVPHNLKGLLSSE
jgi:hypothetical protein